MPISHTTGSLLTVSTGELVSNLGNLDGSHFDLDEEVALVVVCEHDLVDDTVFRVSQLFGTVVVHLLDHIPLPIVILIRVGSSDLTYDDIVSTNLASRRDQAINIELVVRSVLQSNRHLAIRPADLLFLRVLLVIGPKEY